MATPNNRCIHNRYHSDPATCVNCEEVQSRRDDARRKGTPYAEFDEEPSTLPARRRRARRGEQVEEEEETSPLRSRSTNLAGGLLEDEEEDEGQDVLVPDTPMSQGPANDMPSSASSTSTQIIAETPLSQLRGPHNPNFDREGSPAATEIVAQGANTEAVKQKILDLRAQRNRLVQNLEQSTTARNTLRERAFTAEGELQQAQAILKQTEAERDVALARSERVPRTNRWLVATLSFVLMCIMLYVLWCWHKAPEMEYIRQRRVAILME